MTAVNELLGTMTRRYGLAPRDGWGEEARRLLDDLSDTEGGSPHEALASLADRLTIPESYFFRHPRHFEELERWLAERILRGRRRPVKVLSLGCAGGEEAYSLAILARRTLFPSQPFPVEIRAVDLSRESIVRARAGRFSHWSFRGTDPLLRSRWFLQEGEDRWLLDKKIRDSVVFEVRSIQSTLQQIAKSEIDIVFCRNVAIYLVADARRDIYREIRRVLSPEGLFFLAPADPRPDEGFCRASENGLALRPESLRKRRRALPADLPLSPRPGPVHRPTAGAPSAEEQSERRDPPSPVDFASRAPAPHRASFDPPTSTENSCQAAELLFRRGLETLSSGTPEGAVEILRQAIYLQPTHRLGRFWYAVALGESGDARRALVQLRTLVDTLDREPPERLVEDEAGSVAELKNAAVELLESLV